MAKITDKTLLNVWTEINVDEANKEFELLEAWNLIAKDWVTIQALYSKFVDLWATSTYQDSPFPMNALDALSGQFLIGIDAGWNANGWKPKNDTTRQMMRDWGWEEYDAGGTLNRVYAGIVWLGAINTWAQPYYQTSIWWNPTNSTFDDQINEGIQVYWDALNGNFDNRTYFKAFVREQGKKYSDSILADTGKTATGAYIVNMLLSNEDDLKIADADSEMTNAPYDGITVEYFGSAQQRNVWGTDYDFSVIVDWNNATLEQIYTKLQYLLRQNSDIDNGAGTVTGSTADLLAWFVWDTLETTVWVYIDNIQNADSNRIRFKDDTGTFRENPFVSSGNLTFNAVMVWAWSSYRLMYTTWPWTWDDYGEAGAITVKDNNGNDITWEISYWTIPFTFDYDNDTAGWDAKTDKAVTLIWIRPNSSKFAVAEWTLTASKAITLWLVAEKDRAYL